MRRSTDTAERSSATLGWIELQHHPAVGVRQSDPRGLQVIHRLAKGVLARFGVAAVRQATLDELKRRAATRSKFDSDTALLAAMGRGSIAELMELLALSRGQLRQDVLALAVSGFKRDGFFVEFGATDGINLSNTWLLERVYGWKGILAEPGRCWHKALWANRDAAISTRCVWSRTGERVSFRETEIPELSTVEHFGGDDAHAERRTRGGSIYDVETISLNDLLQTYSAPSQIDYLSIDTEGSEYEILRAFDFSAYRFSLITCEHNFTPARLRIHELLESHGYRRILENLSAFDDWYIDRRDVDVWQVASSGSSTQRLVRPEDQR